MKRLLSLLLGLTLLGSTFTPSVLALPITEAEVITLTATGDLVDGIAKKVELHPFGETLDEAITLRFEADNILMPEDERFADHLYTAFVDPLNSTLETQYLKGSFVGEYYEVDVQKTGIYFLRHMVPQEITISMNAQTAVEGESITVQSEQLRDQRGEVLWDGYPFWVQGRAAEISGDKKNDRGHSIIESQNGILSFEVTPNAPGTFQVFVYTPFAGDGPEGSLTLEAADNGEPLLPPSNVRIQGNELLWDKTTSTGYMGYLLYYRDQGETEWNGVDYRFPSSPVAVGSSPKELSFENPLPRTYEIALQTFDAAGNTSDFSNIVTYTAPSTDYDYEQEIQNLVQEQEELLNESSTSNIQNFSDIRSPILQEAVQELVSRGIISGYPDGTFRPEQVINRAETLKILLEAAQVSTDPEAPQVFPDVDNTLWFAPYVSTAKKLQLISGYPDGTYRPTQEVNRAEFIKIAMSLQANYRSDVDPRDAIAQYSDLDTDEWYMPFLSFAFNQGFLNYSDRFEPTEGMTRGDAALILSRIVKSQN